jgi:hypothetical protein
MTTDTPRQQRLAIIATQRIEASRLLTIAQHESIKAGARLALRDLDEALLWLDEQDVHNRPHILDIVDTVVSLATQRMAMVAEALADDGPGATEIG